MSRTRAAIGPRVDRSAQPGGFGPPTGTRPSDGFMPVMPHSDDGMRIEPPPSDPVHSGTSPAAMAAAEPPDEPPALRGEVPRVARWPRRAGSRCRPCGRVSGVLVLPTTMQPAALSRSTSGESLVAIGLSA